MTSIWALSFGLFASLLLFPSPILFGISNIYLDVIFNEMPVPGTLGKRDNSRDITLE